MKKKINGKLYNTDTATKIFEYDNSYYGDEKGYSETLYQKYKRFEFFLFCQGGKESIYPEPVIKLITMEEAKKWSKNRGFDFSLSQSH